MNRTIFISAIIITLLSASISFGQYGSGNLRQFEGQPINKIEIVRRNVFDDKMKSNALFYYRWGNALHVMTREAVIRRELLFHEGEPLDVLAIEESQRNLRLSGFISDVFVVARPDESGHGVDLEIITTDLWTTDLSLYWNLAGGQYDVGLSGSEGNFLGLGKFISISGEVGNDQNGGELLVIDNRIFGTRLGITGQYARWTFDKFYLLNIIRPQYSLRVPFGFFMTWNDSNTRLRLFSGGNEYFRYKQKQHFFRGQAIYSIGLNRRINFTAGVDYRSLDYAPDIPDSPLNGHIPADEVQSYPSVGVGGSSIRYGLGYYLDQAGTPEDLTYGASLTYGIGRSAKALGANYIGWSQSISLAFLRHPLPWLYVGGLERVHWWNRNDANERINHRSEAALYFKPAERHLVAFHGLTDFAWRQKSGYQVILGGGNGLRGYSFYELSGNRLALGNIEYRYFTPLEILTARPGLALFFDFGNVWQRGEQIDMKDMKSNIGIGLRVGMTKSATSRVLSLNIARPLTKSGYYISFGTINIFDLKFMTKHD